MNKSVEPMTDHKVDMLLLAICVHQYLTKITGLFSCLIRSDYNFIIYLFCYFVWQNRKDALALKIVCALLFRLQDQPFFCLL